MSAHQALCGELNGQLGAQVQVLGQDNTSTNIIINVIIIIVISFRPAFSVLSILPCVHILHFFFALRWYERWYFTIAHLLSIRQFAHSCRNTLRQHNKQQKKTEGFWWAVSRSSWLKAKASCTGVSGRKCRPDCQPDMNWQHYLQLADCIHLYMSAAA